MKKSFNDLVNTMEVLQENEKGKLKGGFTSAFTFEVEQSALLGNNCQCKNYHSSCDKSKDEMSTFKK